MFKTSARGREQVLRLLRPGDMFNEVAVFDEGPNPASAQAIEDCTLYLLRRRDLLRFVAQRPGIAIAITRTFAGRLREALALVEALAVRDVTSRLAKILLEGRDGRPPRLTQELLAAMAGSRREVVGRALKALSQDGAYFERGRIRAEPRHTRALAWMTQVTVRRCRLQIIGQGQTPADSGVPALTYVIVEPCMTKNASCVDVCPVSSSMRPRRCTTSTGRVIECSA